MHRRAVVAAGVAAVAAVAGCADLDDEEDAPGDEPTGEGDLAAPSLASPAFDDGAPIPERHTCSGEDASPPLSVSDVPSAAETLALVVDDPDAPREEPWVHWLLWNVPADATEIPEGVPRGGTVESLDGARQGTNTSGTVGYSGPCPPPDDDPHTYRFLLYAVAGTLDVEPEAGRDALDAALDDHDHARTILTGTYGR